MKRLRGQDSVELMMSLMKKHQPCGANELIEHGFNLSRLSTSHRLDKMHKCGCVSLVDRVKTGFRYELTGLSPIAQCEQCNKTAFRWNLSDGHCYPCLLGRKGGNQQIAEEFAFLRNPAFKLLNKVFAQGAKRMETNK
ncbi:hypothetical protein L9W80_16975 [Vibrio aestuarianus]|uniref:hypothetical protein n=1 Tax=Vibrio aestuarianus TaxID=28171 RepID=UPI00237CEA26|nr:hypothetical protein [Vibrio aestuarianus]MDE1351841.1 hypothetical protein [Vibrio aestuarianus]